MTAFVYEAEKYRPVGIQILGISVQGPDEGKKLRDRVIEDSREDRPGMSLNPFPVRFICDSAGELIRKAGAVRESDKRGFIARPMSMVVDRSGKIHWLYTGDGSPADRPGPTRLANIAVAVIHGRELPEKSPSLSFPESRVS